MAGNHQILRLSWFSYILHIFLLDSAACPILRGRERQITRGITTTDNRKGGHENSDSSAEPKTLAKSRSIWGRDCEATIFGLNYYWMNLLHSSHRIFQKHQKKEKEKLALLRLEKRRWQMYILRDGCEPGKSKRMNPPTYPTGIWQNFLHFIWSTQVPTLETDRLLISGGGF